MGMIKMSIPENFISTPLKINGIIAPKPEGENFKCDFCKNSDQTFKTWDELGWHITKEHNENYKKDPDEFMRRRKK